MKTQELIAILALDPPQKAPRMALGVHGFILLLLCGTATTFWLGLRADLNSLSFPLSFWFKSFVLGALIFLSLQALTVSSVPMSRFRQRSFVVAFAVIILISLALEWVTKPADQIAHLFLQSNFKECVAYSTLFGAGVSLVLLAAVKKYAAPPNLARTAGFIGLAAACIGGLGYSIHCPVDSPTFILVAHGLPQLTLYVVARLLFARFLRW